MFRFDGGDAAFAAAETTTDPAQRAEMLATGIRQLIDEGKYAQAVQKMGDIRDEKFGISLTPINISAWLNRHSESTIGMASTLK